MTLSREFMLERMLASDRAWNGRFLTGVLSTGIYCLPSCTARKPKPENVRFFFTETEAQSAGLRACRRCRPNDFYRDFDPDFERLTALTAQIGEEPGAFEGVESLAESSGLGVTKLHALFRRHYHTTPAVYLNRARIAAACRLLTDPAAPTALDAAVAVGYESLSAFNENFRRWTGLSPTEYRRLGAESTFAIALPPNYRPEYPLGLQGRDAESRTERVQGCCLTKAIHLDERPALLHLEFCGEIAQCRVEAASTVGAEEMRAAHGIALRLLNLASDPGPFERRLEEQGDLFRLVERRQGLRIPLAATLFEGLVWSIVGQQVNLSFAASLRRTLAELCGERIDDRFVAHPTPQQIAQLDYSDLTPRQFSRSKAEYLIDTARLIASGELPLETFADAPASQVEKRLLAQRGLGPWSVNYLMLRSCGFADCVPVGDSGLRAALKRFYALDTAPDAPQTLALMEAFAPFRSLATYHLWYSLGEVE
ncbi:MAG TPA: Ada metal-binding domain-containing protein [Chthonomonadaceae bacterium]|nr:Ada metal-binding domain-containing protein [Chthonomonadaceae bacterium]